MTTYDPNEECTFYFVIYNDSETKRIQAWTDVKDYAKFYIDFHQCPMHKLKTMTAQYKSIMPILNENLYDEISLVNLEVRNDKHHKKGHETKMITVPLTRTEGMLINDEAVSFMASRIDYSYIESTFYYLKNKYQRTLKDVYLYDVMNKVIHEKESLFTNTVQMDQLMIMFRSLSEHFGA